MHDRIWLSFDLARGGDFTGMYRWLANRQARECGPGLASLVFHYYFDLIEELKKEVSGHIKLGPMDRVYVIYKDPEDGETTGIFIFGNRAHKQGFPIKGPSRFSQLN